MALQEYFSLKGSVHVQLFDKDGVLKQEHENHNLVVTVGKNYLAAWVAAASQSGYFMQYMSVGTGTNAPNLTDTGLQTPLPTVVAGTITSSGAIWQNVATFAPGVNTGAITEAGLFSAVSSGTMFARQVFSVYNKGAGDTLIITWTVTFS
jgi:hypothetical protein